MDELIGHLVAAIGVGRAAAVTAAASIAQFPYEYAREQAGENAVDGIVGAVSGLGQFV
jgi:hypothetical protein